jgi:transcriptional regulator with XRE-family HTH domain
MMENFGVFVRFLREKKDISVRELARRLDASAAFISDIELGRRYPSDDVLGRLAAELEVSVDELRCHDPRPPVEEMKRLTDLDPAFGLAFRTLLNKEVTADDLLKLAETRPVRNKP